MDDAARELLLGDLSPERAFWWMLAISFVLGSAVGSFLNVVIYRVPRGESIVTPSSHCPACKRPIPGWANVPILAWIALRARCVRCGAHISGRYPLVESLVALLFAALFLHRGVPEPRLFVDWVLASLLVAAAFIRFDTQRIPDSILYLGIALGLVSAWLSPRSGWSSPFPFWLSSVAGALCVGALVLGVSLLTARFTPRTWIDASDAKLVAMLGAFLGLDAVGLVLVAGAVAGTALWLVLRAAGRASDRSSFTAALALAAFAYLLAPTWIPPLLPR